MHVCWPLPVTRQAIRRASHTYVRFLAPLSTWPTWASYVEGYGLRSKVHESPSLYSLPTDSVVVYVSSYGTFHACSHCSRHFEKVRACTHLPESKAIRINWGHSLCQLQNTKNSPVIFPQCSTHWLNEIIERTNHGKAGFKFFWEAFNLSALQYEKILYVCSTM